MTLLQLVINGVALGAAYALVALGFVFIVNATGAVNFAQGDLVMAGGYAAVGLGTIAGCPDHCAAAARRGDHVRGRDRGGAGRLFSAHQSAAVDRVHQHASVRHRAAEPVPRAIRATGARGCAAHQKRYRAPGRNRHQHPGTRHPWRRRGFDCGFSISSSRAPKSAGGCGQRRKTGRWRKPSAFASPP